MNRYEKLKFIARIHRTTDIGDVLRALGNAGFSPGIYKRGKLWRMHIDCATNCWHDGRTPISAFRGVLKQELKLEKNKVAL